MSAVFDNDVEVNTGPGSGMALGCAFFAAPTVASVLA